MTPQYLSDASPHTQLEHPGNPVTPGTILLELELCLVFVVVPMLMNLRLVPTLPIPYLLLVSLAAYLWLRRDPGFDRNRLWNFAAAADVRKAVLIRDAVLIAVMGLGVWLFMPERLFSLIKRDPLEWAAIMIFYPMLSVYPQELIFRAFFFRRYLRLFGSGWGMTAASALAFGFVHIIFGSWISVLLSAIGGVLFSLTYRKSGSLLLTCVEHALFGNFIFTIGLGEFFYHGTRH
jgi:membrane protease YdiL (CAAX protease family)